MKNLFYVCVFLLISNNLFCQTASLSVNQSNLCQADTIIIDINIVGGIGPFTAAFSFFPYTANLNSGSNLFTIPIQNSTNFNLYYVSDQGNGGSILTLLNPSLQVTINSSPIIYIDSGQIDLCYGDIHTIFPIINSSEPISFNLFNNTDTLFFNNYSNGDSILLQANANTIYYIDNVIDNNGCIGSSFGFININLLSVSASLNPINNLCENQASFLIDNGFPTGGDYYVNGTITDSITPNYLGSGTHSLEYIYNNNIGCSDSASILITIYPQPSVQLLGINNEYCNNNKPFLLNHAIPSSGQYFLNNVLSSVFDPSLLNIGYNLLIYEYTDTNNCSSRDSININILSSTPINLNPINNTCDNGNNIILNNASPIGGNFYVNENLYNQNSLNPKILGLGTHEVKYEFIDTNGCISIDSISFEIFESPDISFIINNPKCFDSTGSIQLNISGGTQPYLENWYSANPNQLTNGLYYLTIVDSNQCIIDTSFNIVSPSNINVQTLNIEDNICFGDSVGYISIAVTGGTPNYSINWSGPNGYNSNQISIYNLKSGIYSYVLNDINGCSVSNNFEIEDFNDELIYNFSHPNQSICQNESAVIISQVSGASFPCSIIYKINNNEKSLLYDGINNPIYDLDSSSNLYFDKIIDNNGCIKKIDFGFFMEVKPIPSGNINGGSTVCNIDTLIEIIISTDAVKPYNLTYTNSSDTFNINNINSDFYSFLSNFQGVYKILKIEDKNICINENFNSYTEIKLFPEYETDFYVSDYNIFIDQQIEIVDLSPNLNKSYWIIGNDEFNVNQESFYYSFLDTGKIEIVLISSNENNCIDTVIKNINIYPRLEYYVPNSFTPNNDRLNDEFEIKCNGAKEIEITIFNRWGEKIFYKKSNTNIAWTGDNQVSGIYLYKLRIVDFNDSITNKIGELLLIK